MTLEKILFAAIAFFALCSLPARAQELAPAQERELQEFRQAFDDTTKHLEFVLRSNVLEPRYQPIRMESGRKLSVIAGLQKDFIAYVKKSAKANPRLTPSQAMLEFIRIPQEVLYDRFGTRVNTLSQVTGMWSMKKACLSNGGSWGNMSTGDTGCTLKADPVAAANRAISSGVLPAGHRHGPMVRDSGGIQDAGAPK